MDQATVWQAVQAWPIEEQREFAERLLDELDPETIEPDDSPEFLAELDRRCAEHDADPSTAIPWEEVLKRLRSRA